ncbi:hypothetical protein BU24DRAFT_61857 [Aaosphaeria arxii CBS 175.79]|uniref:Heterokaryon incompatibility domain-containing protein n=1 Tax=Aaosphaeria arxii CBS 175.79 TaxID=1450172 RepID=A0A6A5XCI4_9PLEO|nr:uncharacterized protein BU24DRAFT_61857 [Aaosphaeria arxii CBS 175.79]KAF2010619.1 hypothetical protein BU24DRAFT_61857 [Aaosphaeria arxii CBS 175.79]
MPSKRAKRMRQRRKQQAKETPPLPAPSPYQYKRLANDSSIRVLELLPSLDGEINCSLTTVDLDDNPTFGALSYSWANPITIREEPIPGGPVGQKIRNELIAKPMHLSKDSPGVLYFEASMMFFLAVHSSLPYLDHEHGRDRCKKIMCDGQELNVTETLFSALLQLRRIVMSKLDAESKGLTYLETLPVSRSKYIWIDAICINQEDIDERNAQVPLMNRIFASAQYVFAWIGEMDSLGAAGISAIINLENSLAKKDDWERDPGSEDIPRKQGERKMDMYAMTALLLRLWFHRAWVVQEAVYARRLYLWSGGIFIEWWNLVHAIRAIGKEGVISEMAELMAGLISRGPTSQLARKLRLFEAISKGKAVEAPEITEEEIFDRIEAAVSFVNGVVDIKARLGLPTFKFVRKEKGTTSPFMIPLDREGLMINYLRKDLSEPFANSTPGQDRVSEAVRINGSFLNHDLEPADPVPPEPISLFSLLTRFRDVGASDPRDKVFAFLHLATEIPGMKANYRANTQYILKVATKIIFEIGDLSIFSHVQDPADTKIKDLPSWVPDLSVPLKRKPLIQDNKSSPYSACGSAMTQPKFYLTAEEHGKTYEVLVLCGYHVDTVVDLADEKGCYFTRVAELALRTPKMYSKKLGGDYTYKGNFLMRMSQDRDAVEPGTMSRVEALWRTMIADAYSDIHPAPVSIGFGFSDWVAAHIHHSLHLSGQIQSLIDKETDKTALKNLRGFLDSQERKRKVWGKLHADENGLYICHECAMECFNEISPDDEFTQQLKEMNLTPTMHPSRYLPDEFRQSALLSCMYMELSKKERPKNFACPVLTPEEKTRKQQFERRMQEVKKGRRMFRTERNLLGMGPKSVQPGDEIWVLFSAKVPFVVRPIDNGKAPKRATLVGEAYLHGYMDGEVLSEKREIQTIGLV